MIELLRISELQDLLVPISRFNKTDVNEIFNEVHRAGMKVVLKNNTPVCVLLSPTRYNQIAEMLEDYELYQIAMERMSPEKVGIGLSQEEVMQKYGISNEDLDNVEVNID